MTFYERLDAAVDLLRRRGRVSCRALKRELDLDDALLEDLRAELVDVQRVVREEDGAVLVWIGPAADPSGLSRLPAAPPPSAAAGEAERRQVTVMFCELVRAGELAARVDPEQLRDVLRAYQDAADAAVRHFGGVVARSVGDGLLIYFGYPLAHEDDALRAVRAALAIVAAVRELHARLEPAIEPLRDIPLQARIGLHTGLAVMGSMGDSVHRDDMAAVGETPNLAARIRGLADPDEVLVTAATHRLLRGAFTCEALGPRPLRGIAAPVLVYRVLREPEATEPRDGLVALRSPLVGREQEVGLLLERWAQVKEGVGQVVLLSGEAGIGKSRLVHALKAHAAAELHSALETRCSPFHQSSALFPVTELLQQVLQGQGDCPPERQLDRLEHTLGQHGLSVSGSVPLLAPLLGLRLPGAQYPASTLSPERQRQQTLETVVALVLELAARQPVLLIVEDLHWIDPSTMECLGVLIEQVPTTRLLALFTARPEFRPPWANRAHITPLALGRLRRTQIEALIGTVAGGKSLPLPVVEQVATKTDGVPLFVEELTKMVLESGLLREEEDRYELVGPLPPLAIPATLQDSLTARLDRLASVKAVAQIGATIGRSFPYDLLCAVAALDETALQRELGELVEAELLYQRGVPPQATYTFKHALIQEAAYQTLLKSTRQLYHQRIAQALEAGFAEAVETHPELLAHHYTEAGLATEAIRHWRRAGERALARFANLEAISHLTRSLDLLRTLPENAERARHELGLQLTLAIPLIVARSWAAPEVEGVYARARDLCRDVGEPPQLLRALRGLATFYWTRAELRTARDIAEECLGLASRIGDPLGLVRAHLTLGYPLLWLGELAQARLHLEHAAAGESASPSRVRVLVQDPVVTARASRAAALWLLGLPDQALDAVEDAVRLAEKLAHPFSLAVALHFSAMVHQFRREEAATQACADALVTLSTEQGLAFWAGAGMISRGWARAASGPLHDAVAEIRRGLAIERSTGTELSQPHGLTVLADTCLRGGLVEEGLEALAQALAAAHRSEERMCEAEIHRLRAELLVTQARRAEAEVCLQQALRVARGQQAKSLELRAATSLARVWHGQGKQAEARRLLSESYGCFREGFDTADLREARASLDALG